MSEGVFWICVSIALSTYFVYPVVLRLLVMRAGPQEFLSISQTLPSVAIIIVAYNEEAVMGGKVRNALEQDYAPNLLNVYVISDGSTDATVQVAEKAGGVELGKRLRVTGESERSGKTACTSRLLAMLHEDVLVFTDANALFAPDAVRQLVEKLDAGDVGCVVGELQYENAEAPGVRSGEGLYWRYENAIKEMESRLGSTIVANGAIYAVWRHCAQVLPQGMEYDSSVPLRILEQGKRVVFARHALAREKAATSLVEELRRKKRIVNMQVVALMYEGRRLLRISPGGLIQLFFHKILRWLVAPALPAAWFAAFVLRENNFYFAAWTGGMLFIAAALAGLMLHGSSWHARIIRLPAYFLVVNAAAFLGLVTALTGVRYGAWEKAASTR
jgi:cellulose synthase/poly-beta-1,6-N-acetylglucosamine synthase-like glycosyltransferase